MKCASSVTRWMSTSRCSAMRVRISMNRSLVAGICWIDDDKMFMTKTRARFADYQIRQPAPQCGAVQKFSNCCGGATHAQGDRETYRAMRKKGRDQARPPLALDWTVVAHTPARAPPPPRPRPRLIFQPGSRLTGSSLEMPRGVRLRMNPDER